MLMIILLLNVFRSVAGAEPDPDDPAANSRRRNNYVSPAAAKQHNTARHGNKTIQYSYNIPLL